MNIHSIIQDAVSVLNLVVLALGYYSLLKLYSAWFRENKRARIAGGRPQVVVAADYSHLPNVGLVVRNFTQAPAKDVSFEFSAPVEAPDGTVISELPYLRKGLPFIEPNGQVSRAWGRLPDLAPLLREKGLENGIQVTTKYEDLAGEPYETHWTLDPLLFEGSGIERSKGMDDLVVAVEGLSDVAFAENDGRRKAAGGPG